MLRRWITLAMSALSNTYLVLMINASTATSDFSLTKSHNGLKTSSQRQLIESFARSLDVPTARDTL
jgi:hypothetical protein